MKRYLPFLGWLLGGILMTAVLCFILFIVGFLNRSEDGGNSLGAASSAIVFSIYIIMPVGVLVSMFVALTKLRGVIDGEPNKTPEPTS